MAAVARSYNRSADDPEDRLFDRIDYNQDGAVDRQELRRAYQMGSVSTPGKQDPYAPPPRENPKLFERAYFPRMDDGSVDKVALWRQRRREEVKSHTQRADRSPSGSVSPRTPRQSAPTPTKAHPPRKALTRKEERDQAATKIQAKFRGDKARNDVDARRRGETTPSRGATTRIGNADNRTRVSFEDYPRQAPARESAIGQSPRGQSPRGRSPVSRTQSPTDRGLGRTRQDGHDSASSAPLLAASESLLLLRFPDAPWPAPLRFENELRKALKGMGAQLLANVDIRLVPGPPGGSGIIAELRASAALLADLCKLPLYNLRVLGYRVGDVRSSERGPPSRKEAATKIQAGVRGKKDREKVARMKEEKMKEDAAKNYAKKKRQSQEAMSDWRPSLTKGTRSQENLRGPSSAKASAAKGAQSVRPRRSVQEQAATKIQARVRGNQGRKKVEKEREKQGLPRQPKKKAAAKRKPNPKAKNNTKYTRKEKDAAATKIQSRYRGNKARKEVSEKGRDARQNIDKKKRLSRTSGNTARSQLANPSKSDAASSGKFTKPSNARVESPARIANPPVAALEKPSNPMLANSAKSSSARAESPLRVTNPMPDSPGRFTTPPESPIPNNCWGAIFFNEDNEFQQRGKMEPATVIQTRWRGSFADNMLADEEDSRFLDQTQRMPSPGRSSPGRLTSPGPGRRMLQTLDDEDRWFDRVNNTSRYINVIRQQSAPTLGLQIGAHQAQSTGRQARPKQRPQYPRSREATPTKVEDTPAKREHSQKAVRKRHSRHTDHASEKPVEQPPTQSASSTAPPPESQDNAEIWLVPHTPRTEQDRIEALWNFRNLLFGHFGSLEEAAKAMDSEGISALITMKELKKFFAKVLGLPDPQRQAADMFNLLDKNLNGKLTVSEAISVLQNLRFPFQVQEAEPNAEPAPKADANPKAASGKARAKAGAGAGKGTNRGLSPRARNMQDSSGGPLTPRSHAHQHPERDMSALNAQYLGFRNPVGQRQGFGVLRGKDGTTYSGQWSHGKREGHGALFFEGGVFEGEWLNGNAHGKGNVYFKNGDHFKGMYEANKKHGLGKYRWADGAVEEGDYYRGVKNGWHTWRRGKERWDLHYETGNVTAATRGKDEEKGKGRRSDSADKASQAGGPQDGVSGTPRSATVQHSADFVLPTSSTSVTPSKRKVGEKRVSLTGASLLSKKPVTPPSEQAIKRQSEASKRSSVKRSSNATSVGEQALTPASSARGNDRGNFDGTWTKEGTGAKFEISGKSIYFVENDKRFDFEAKNKACFVTAAGKKLEGAMEKSDQIKWKNGSTWVREASDSY